MWDIPFREATVHTRAPPPRRLADVGEIHGPAREYIHCCEVSQFIISDEETGVNDWVLIFQAFAGSIFWGDDVV